MKSHQKALMSDALPSECRNMSAAGPEDGRQRMKPTPRVPTQSREKSAKELDDRVVCLP